MNIDSVSVNKMIFGYTSIRTVLEIKDVERAVFISNEKGATDAIKLIIDNKGSYVVELQPKEGIDSAFYIFDDLSSACQMFEALHFYRNQCVVPFISELVNMI